LNAFLIALVLPDFRVSIIFTIHIYNSSYIDRKTLI